MIRLLWIIDVMRQGIKEMAFSGETGGFVAECVAQVKHFRQEVGVPVGFHWYNWHQIPFDNDYPHYFPPKDGFAEGVAELKTASVYAMPNITADWQWQNEWPITTPAF